MYIAMNRFQVKKTGQKNLSNSDGTATPTCRTSWLCRIPDVARPGASGSYPLFITYTVEIGS